jgi:outer membrane protein assembly factor BamB
VLPKPGFPPPASDASSSGARLELVSSTSHSPIAPTQQPPARPSFVPKTFRGAGLDRTIRQGLKVFAVYGGRYLLAGNTRERDLPFAFDLVNFGRPPRGSWFEDVTFAREAGGVIYVSNTHLTYATATNRRNAYITAIDPERGKTLWRSRALVANSRTFVVTGTLLVTGYGFTAEDDFLYVLDRRNGRVLDRLEVPSAPEIIKLRGKTLEVRTYDSKVVARVVP